MCIATLCLLLTLPAISGAQSKRYNPDCRIVTSEAQRQKLRAMRANAEYDALHKTNQDKYYTHTWVNPRTGDIWTVQFNKEKQPLCELISFVDAEGNPFTYSFEELPFYCVTYTLLIQDKNSGNYITNLSLQLCWPSYYVWNQRFEWAGQLDENGDIPLQYRNYNCVTPDDLMNSTKWCRKFQESNGVGAKWNDEGTNWEYFTCLPNEILGFKGMVNDELGYTAISDSYASNIEFQSYEEEGNIVSYKQVIYFNTVSGKFVNLRGEPVDSARIEGFVPRTDNLSEFGDIHLFNVGLGGSNIGTNLYPVEWGPLSQFYVVAADKNIEVYVPQDVTKFDKDRIITVMGPDISAEDLDSYANVVKGYLYADPKYSNDPTLNPTNLVYNLIFPTTVNNNIIIKPEANSFVAYGVGSNPMEKWSEDYGMRLRVKNFENYFDSHASMAFGTEKGYQFNCEDYYGNTVNAYSRGNCIYHYDPNDVQKTRVFPLYGNLEYDPENPVTPIDPVDPTEGAHYAGLIDNADGWKYYNLKLPEGVSYIWSWDDSYGGYLRANAYVNYKANASEGYAVSPVIDLTGVSNPVVSFDHAAKFQTNIRKVCQFLVRESGTTNWNVLEIPVWPEGGNWIFVNSGSIDLSAYTGKKIELGFKYVSTDTEADTWEIKNLIVKEGTPIVNYGEYYIIGTNVNGQEWVLSQPDAQFTKVSPGVYKWTGEQLGSGFKINDGTWENIDINFGSNGSPLVLGSEYWYECGELADNIYIDQYPLVLNPVVILNVNNGTITVTGDPQGEYTYEWYITGLASDGDNQFADKYILSPVSGKTDVFEAKNVVIDKEGEFKVCNDGYTNQFGFSVYGDMIDDNNLSAYLAPQPVNIFGMPFNLHGKYDITWDLSQQFISFVKVGSEFPPVDPTKAVLTVRMQNGPGMVSTLPVNSVVSTQFDLDEYWSVSSASVNGASVEVTGSGIKLLMDGDKTLDVEISYNGNLEWIENTGVASFEGSSLTISVEAGGAVTVAGAEIGDEIVIYSLSGQVMGRHYVRSAKETLRPEPGIYVIRVKDNAAKVTVR